jgi:hypothetical protein
MNQKEAYEQGKANGYEAAIHVTDEDIEDAEEEIFGTVPRAGSPVRRLQALEHAAYENEDNARQYSGFAGFAAEINNGPESRIEGLWESYEQGVTVGINKGVREWLKGQTKSNPDDIDAIEITDDDVDEHYEPLYEAAFFLRDEGWTGGQWSPSYGFTSAGPRQYLQTTGDLNALIGELEPLAAANDDVHEHLDALREVFTALTRQTKSNPRKMRKRIPKKIEIWGKRWFQRSYGNTYHTVRIYLNDKLVYESPQTYGYGDHYLQTAKEWLVENGYYPPASDRPLPIWSYFSDKGTDFTYHATDVKRERDL